MRANRISRRDFLQLALVSAGAAGLAACQAPTPTPQPAAPATATTAPKATAAPVATTPAPAAQKKTLDWWIVWGEDTFGHTCQKVAELYHGANPNVEVKVGLNASGSVEKTMTAIAGGVPPDVTELGPVGELGMRKALLSLDDMIKASGIDLNDIWEASIKRGSWAGKIYWLPFQADYTSALMWNKELFEKAGLDPEKPPTNWAEMREISDKLTQKDGAGNITNIGIRPTDGIGTFAGTWSHAAGGTLFDENKLKYNLDTPEMADAINYIVGYYKAYGPEAMAAFSTNVGGWTGSKSAFVRGLQGMLINGSWAPGSMRDVAPNVKVGYTFLPTKTLKKIQLIGGHGNGIPSNVKDPKAAWDFMAFVNGPTGRKTFWDEARMTVPSKSWVATLQADDPGVDWFLKHAYNDADEKGYLQETLPLHDLMNAEFNPLIEGVAAGKIQVKDGLAEWQKKVDAAFEQAKGQA